jgi:hypothetical protein
MSGSPSHMRSERIDETLLIRYLLGRLGEEEQVQVEDRAFADAEYLAALEAAEADLIDNYIGGALSRDDRRAFEQRFLVSPQRRDKIQFARDFARVAAELKPTFPARMTAWQAFTALMQAWTPTVRFAAAAAALVLVATAALLLVQNTAMRSQVAALESQQKELQSRAAQLDRQLAEAQARTSTLTAQAEQPLAPRGTVDSLVLQPGLARAESRREKLVVHASSQLARIEVGLEPRDEYPSFRVELRTQAAAEVLTLGNLRKRQNAVTFEVPASALAAGDYELALKGVSSGQSVQDIGFYYFTVQKQ